MLLPDFRVRQRDYMLEISRAITRELDLEKLLGRILAISVEMLAGQAGLIALRDEDENWSIPVSSGLPEPFLKYLVPYLAEISKAEDADQFEMLELNRRLVELAHKASRGLLNGVVLPLITRQTIVGVIFLFRSYSDQFSNQRPGALAQFCGSGGHCRAECTVVFPIGPQPAAVGCPAGFGGGRHFDSVTQSTGGTL